MSEITMMDTEELDKVNDIQLVGMKLGDEEYAIDVLKIQEIIRTVEITIVPRSESFVLGVMNMRGKVVPVIDLRVRFNLEKSDFDKSTRIIVVRFEKEHIGFVVDEVTQVFRISKSMVEPTPPLVGAIGQEYILGICKYDDHLIILLDIDRIISNSNAMGDSDLRKKFLGKPSKKINHLEAEVSVAPAPEAHHDDEEDEHDLKTYSMADEADSASKPLITAAPDADLESVLNDAVKQGSAITTSSAENDVQQGELDSLIAAELSKREAETEELNRKKRESASGGGEAEDALSIDDLIKIELNKREAETEELNKKRREEDEVDKKKNELSETLAQEETEAEIVEELEKPVFSGASSLAELKDIAHKIINGESSELDIDIKGEVGELLRLLVDIKGRVDEIPPTVLNTQSDLPEMSSALTDVNVATERAAFNLLSSAQKMSDFYKSLLELVTGWEEAVKNKDKASLEDKQSKIHEEISAAGELGFHILEALEFQDITEQKLCKVLKYIEDVGARLGVIVGYMKAKDETGGKKYDGVLNDLGFA